MKVQVSCVQTPLPTPTPVPQLLHSFLSETLFSVSATGCQSKLSHCLFFPEPEQILSLPFPSSAFPADGASPDLPHQVHRHPFLELRALLRVSALLCVQSREEPPFPPAASVGGVPGRARRRNRTRCPDSRGGRSEPASQQGRGDGTGLAQHLRGALVACPPQSCHPNLPWG